MSLQSRLGLLEPHETWPSLHNAAWERYWDGIELATCQEVHRTGAIYSLGYVAEILLKVAFFRVKGFAPGQQVELQEINDHPVWPTRAKRHNLAALADVLIEERRLRGSAFDPVFAGEVKTCVAVVASHWRETLRYKHTIADEPELAEVVQNVDWLLNNANVLWS